MAFNDGLKDKILKLGAKQKLGAILKYANNSSEDVRMAVAMALGMIPTYDSGMALIPLLRDQSAMVRASACEAAAQIHAKNCEEYVKKLAFTETDPNVKQVAKKAFDKLSIIVSVAFSYFVFKEKLSRKALAGLILIVVGTLAMAIWA